MHSLGTKKAAPLGATLFKEADGGIQWKLIGRRPRGRNGWRDVENVE